jgi:hypothetical protein
VPGEVGFACPFCASKCAIAADKLLLDVGAVARLQQQQKQQKQLEGVEATAVPDCDVCGDDPATKCASFSLSFELFAFEMYASFLGLSCADHLMFLPSPSPCREGRCVVGWGARGALRLSTPFENKAAGRLRICEGNHLKCALSTATAD